MKFSMGRLVVPMTWVVLSPVVVSSALAGMPVGPATPPEQEAKQKASAEPSTDAIIYTNTKYGFPLCSAGRMEGLLRLRISGKLPTRRRVWWSGGRSSISDIPIGPRRMRGRIFRSWSSL